MFFVWFEFFVHDLCCGDDDFLVAFVGGEGGGVWEYCEKKAHG